MRAVRVIQTSAIAMLLVATSAMLIVSAHATERYSDRVNERAEAYRQAIEYPHIHARPERREHPPLHSEGTRRDSSADDTFYQSDDDFEDELRDRRGYYNDDQEDE